MAMGGCAVARGSKKELVAYTQPVKEEDAVWMRGELIGLMDSATGQISVTAEEIAGSTQDAQNRQMALMWRLRVVPALHTLGQNPDPRQGLVVAWILVVKQRMFFEYRLKTKPGDKDVALMLETSRNIETEAEEAFARHMTPERFDKVKVGIAKLARERVISDVTGGLRSDARDLDPQDTPDDVAAVLLWPLSPLTGIQGVTDTASAVNRLNTSVVRLGLLLEDMPKQARWQADYLLLETQTGKSARELRAAAQEAKEYAERVAKAAEQGLVELEKTRAMISREREVVLKQLGEERTAATRDANEAITRALKEVDSIRAAAFKEFDSQRIKTLETLEQTTGKALDRVGRERELAVRDVEGVIDRAFWRGVMLVVIVFVGALIVVWYARRPIKGALPRESHSGGG
jgi:hypothetical protein